MKPIPYERHITITSEDFAPLTADIHVTITRADGRYLAMNETYGIRVGSRSFKTIRQDVVEDLDFQVDNYIVQKTPVTPHYQVTIDALARIIDLAKCKPPHWVTDLEQGEKDLKEGRVLSESEFWKRVENDIEPARSVQDPRVDMHHLAGPMGGRGKPLGRSSKGADR